MIQSNTCNLGNRQKFASGFLYFTALWLLAVNCTGLQTTWRRTSVLLAQLELCHAYYRVQPHSYGTCVCRKLTYSLAYSSHLKQYYTSGFTAYNLYGKIHNSVNFKATLAIDGPYLSFRNITYFLVLKI